MLNWLKSLFAESVESILTTGVIGAVTTVAAFGWALGPDFFRTRHPVPGWAILFGLGAAVLFGFSVALNTAQWLRSGAGIDERSNWSPKGIQIARAKPALERGTPYGRRR
jgi:drug/metabolite transporter (DMT)-like permease